MSSGLIFLTLARTFMRIMLLCCNDSLLKLTFAVRDSALRKIVRGQLDRNAVAGDNSDKMLPHLTCDMSYDFMAIFELYPELCPWQCFDDGSRQLDYFLVGCHKYN